MGFIPNTSTLGVNLSQVLCFRVLPIRSIEDHSIGASLVVGYQSFRSYGLGDFAAFGFSSDPANLTNKGDDTAWGAGGALAGPGN